MLKTRVMTALVLLAVLLALFFYNSFPAFAFVAAVFFAAAAWESARLFKAAAPVLIAAIWTAIFAWIAFRGISVNVRLLSGLCVAIWAVRMVPSLGMGLPPLESAASRLLSVIYGVAIIGCFVAILVLFKHSALYLFSVMAIVWIADIGAYFSGKAFGKRKLAPTISPGKSWEGAVGGWIAVLAITAASTLHPALADTFAARLVSKWGFLALLATMTLMVAASVVGDLFESQLKRRAAMKDSSNLLPGHGGVLDRIDALIPTLPLAVLIDSWL